MRLLYVDDDRINLLLFEAACHGLDNIETRFAETPDAALAAVDSWTPDLFVLDMHLRTCTGPEMLKQLRARPELTHTPAVLFTADTGAPVQQLARDAGFAACWEKPISELALQDALRNLGLRSN